MLFCGQTLASQENQTKGNYVRRKAELRTHPGGPVTFFLNLYIFVGEKKVKYNIIALFLGWMVEQEDVQPLGTGGQCRIHSHSFLDHFTTRFELGPHLND